MDFDSRHQARAAERERIKLQREQRKKQLMLLLRVVVVVVIVVVLLVIAIPLACSGSGESAAETVDTAEAQESIEGAADEVALSAEEELQQVLLPYRQYYFFEEERAQRYLDYHRANPALEPEQVVVRVNVNLDTPEYEFEEPVKDPSSLLALVNKHFNLPRDYEPYDLVSFGSIYIRSEMAQPLEQLISDAASDGVSLTPSSGYRSAAEQEQLYNGYEYMVGTEWADLQSAHPGFSEHQTGYVVDFGPANLQFYDTPQASWLAENSHKYGFIVRFTEENTDVTLYIDEPWHLRYVGAEASTFMHVNNIGSLEEYWVKYVKNSG